MSAEPGYTGPLIGALLALPHQELQQRVHAGMAAAGLPEIRPAHAAIFQWLPPEGGRATELADRIGTTKQAVGYLIDYLEQHGYLERIADPRDARALIVRRTEKGWLVNQTARRLVEEVQADWAERLGPEKMDLLIALLKELLDALKFEYSPRMGGVPDGDVTRRGPAVAVDRAAPPMSTPTSQATTSSSPFTRRQRS